MPQYVKLQASYFRHRKTLRLVGLLGECADIIPVRLWCYASEFLPDGDFSELEPQAIAAIAGFKGDPDKMIAVLQTTRFFAGLRIWDWAKHNGRPSDQRRAYMRAYMAKRRAGEDDVKSLHESDVNSRGKQFTRQQEVAEFALGDDQKPIPASAKSGIPSVPEALRIAALFRRRPDTEWTAGEVKAFKKARPQMSDLAMIERYYASERAKPGDKGIHRKDLSTFLNNYPGELDRARLAGFDKQTATETDTPDGWPEFLRTFEGGKYAKEKRPFRSVDSFIKSDFWKWKGKA